MGVLLSSFISAVQLIFSFDPELINITLVSLRVSGLAVIIGSLLAIPCAFFLNTHSFRGKQFLINIIHTFMGLPPVVVGLFVYLLLSRNGFLGGLEILYTPLAMILAQLIIVIPIVIGVSLAAINNVDTSVKETIITLGATRWQRILGILKEARYGLITALVTGFGAVLSEVGAIMIVGGNIRFQTRALTTAIVLETRRGNFELAMALGIILLTLAFLINYILTHMQQKVVQR